MQETIFYVAAGETLGAVRDFANAKSAAPPTLVRGVSALLRMRLFAHRDGLEPYPLEALDGIVRWQWAMDTDFNEATAYKLQANTAYIGLAEVTDEIDGDEYTYTEVSNPMPQMNTVELAGLKGTDRSRNGLHGEPIGNQAQETLEELVGYRLGKRKRRPRRPEGRKSPLRPVSGQFQRRHLYPIHCPFGYIFHLQRRSQ